MLNGFIFNGFYYPILAIYQLLKENMKWNR